MTALLFSYLIIGCIFYIGASLEAAFEDEVIPVNDLRHVAMALVVLYGFIFAWPFMLMSEEVYAA